MNKGWIKQLLPHAIAIVIFLVVALIYCRPALQGEVLAQSDVTQWKAMAQNSFEYKEKHGHFPLWTNGMFSGMPAYQIAMEPDVAVNPNFFYGLFSLWLPKPFHFFFLASICFYFLTQVLRSRSYIGIIGALAYAYVTYNAIIVAEGHDTKMLTIGLMPGLIGSIILIYQGKYLWGAALTAIFTGLMIGLIHMQIVYYSLIIAFFMTIGYMVHWIRRKEFKHMAFALAIVIGAGLTGLLSNAVQILTTLDSSKTSIRGGSEIPAENQTTAGLSQTYALSYSVYKTEPFVMMVPKMYGGSSRMEVDEEESKAIAALRQMPQEVGQQLQYALRFYWGGIGGTSGPPYVGAIICFLALIGFFLLDNKHKWWILGATVLSLLMSWGEYFLGFNKFLLDTLPMYNKFRAPSMILVIPTFLFCMMAVLVLEKIAATDNKPELWDRYKKGLMLTGGVVVILFLIYFSSDFKSAGDAAFVQQTIEWPAQYKISVSNFFQALEEDRKDLFMDSLLRSLFFIGAAVLLLWLVIRNKFQSLWAFIILGVLSLIDVMTINSKYLNEENYQDQLVYEDNFAASPTDQQIKQDKGYYRVLDLRQGIQPAFNGGALTMYHHHSVGGYHPAKLSIYQDLIEHQLYRFPQSLPVYNMLNTKYVIRSEGGQEQVINNPEALGNVWFVKGARYETTPLAVMKAMDQFQPRDTAVLFAADQSKVTVNAGSPADSIWLKLNDNDDVTYGYSAAAPRFAVFSEVFYDKGWKAYVDGKELPIIRTNYVLRGLTLPAGQNKEIKFEFRPDSFYNGEKIALIAGVILYLLVIAALVRSYLGRKKSEEIVTENKNQGTTKTKRV